MRDLENTFKSLRGQLMVAHPGLLDPNFRQSIVLLSEHTEHEGALGIILNRPLNETLGQARPVFAQSALCDIPLYEGGPVGEDEVILVAWRHIEGTAEMRFYFGTTPEKVAQLLAEDPHFEVRAFLGHAGWAEGQLEGELADSAWLVAPMLGDCLAAEDVGGLWRRLILRLSPELRLLVDAPDDPSVN